LALFTSFDSTQQVHELSEKQVSHVNPQIAITGIMLGCMVCCVQLLLLGP